MSFKIWYGICGEGRGHLCRSKSIMEHLQNDVEVFSYGTAGDILDKQHNPIYGLNFGLKPSGGICYKETLRNFRLWRKHAQEINFEQFDIKAELEGGPDLIISDFEPTICEWGRRNHIPVITIDNQHRFSQVDWSLPWNLAIYNKIAKHFIDYYMGSAKTHVVVAFYPLDNLQENIVQTDVVIRKDLTRGTISNHNYTLVYLHPSIEKFVLPSLEESKQRCIVYTNSGHGKHKNIDRRQYNYNNFSDDLLACSGVIGSAGMQLIGEAHFLNKKMLIIPIDGQHEQHINAYYAAKYGIAQTCRAGNFDQKVFQDFLSYSKPATNVSNGIYDILRVIKHYEKTS